MRFGTGRKTASVPPASRYAPAVAGHWGRCSRRSPCLPRPTRSHPIPAPDRRSFARSRPPVPFRGRHWIAFWLVALLAALWAVIARQTSALNSARALADLHEARASLEGRRADLDRRVRTAQSRAVLLPRARKLGLRLPADTEIILIPAPPSQPPERPF